MEFFANIYIFFTLLLDFINCTHTNNWAIIVDTSRFWFNYRHVANSLAFYRSIKRLGIPDSQIILMLPDDVACDMRNPLPGRVQHDPFKRLDLYGNNIEVDYRGYEVNPENLIRVLTGRVPPTAPSSKRMNTDEFSNILFFMTGHGGDEFIKFQDDAEITSQDLAWAFAQMWQMKRYNEILFIAETCQAETLGVAVQSPNIITLASSRKGENSYSHEKDPDIGVFVSDRFSYAAHEFLLKVSPDSNTTLESFFNVCPRSVCVSNPVYHLKDFKRDLNEVLLTDFFGSVRDVKQLDHFGYPTLSDSETIPNFDINNFSSFFSTV